MHWLLIYDLVDDYLDRRPPLRDERGELVMAGALADPADRAVLVFRAEDASVAESFAAEDPYVTAGLVTRWRVRPWTVVIGA